MEQEKLTVRQFKDSSFNWWCDNKHFLILNGRLRCGAGGVPSPEVIEHMKKYLKTKKISYANI